MNNQYGVSDFVNMQNFNNGKFIETSHAFYYIPNNCSNTTNTIVYAHGAGGVNSDYWEEYIKNNNIDAIYAIPRDRLSSSNMHETNQMLSSDLNSIHSTLGITNNNMFTIGHSSGGKASVYFMLENIKRNPSIGSQTCFVIDPATDTTKDAGFIRSLTSEELKVLGNNHATIVGLEHSGGDARNALNNYGILGAAGANVIVVEMNNMGAYSSEGAHVGIAKFAFNNGMLAYLSGDKKLEDVLKENVKNVYIYDKNTGGFKTATMNEISGYVGTILSSYSNFDQNGNYHSNVNFDNYKNTVKDLKNLEMFTISDLSKVSNDEKFVYTSMNEMRTNLKNTTLLGSGSTSVGCQSTTIVPTCAENFLYDYFAVVLNLSDKISKETQNAINISNGIIKSDQELTAAVEQMMGITETTVYVGGGGGSYTRTTTATPVANVVTGGTPTTPTGTNTGNTNTNNAPIDLKPYTANSLRDKNISTKVYDITADDLNRLFKSWADKTGNYNSPLLGTGEDWIKACNEVGIDPLTMIGICGEETGRGGFNAMAWMSMKNYVGMRYIDVAGDGTGSGVFWAGSNDLFATNYDAILASAKRIKNFYAGKYGGNTIASLAHTGYTGHSDSKGFVDFNNNVANIWASIMKESLDFITGTNGGVKV